MPTLIGGMGNWFIPIHINVPDMAFPRVNALRFWLMPHRLFFAVHRIYLDKGLSAGWTIYPTLRSNIGRPGRRVDSAIVALHLAGLRRVLGSINYICTTGLMRKDGVTLTRTGMLPICIFATAVLLAFSVPVLGASITMLLIDRNMGGNYFRPIAGGRLLRFQHLFWFFGHPEVYVLALPAFAIASQVILLNGGKNRWFGKIPMTWSVIRIMVLGCFVWGHHMFTVGMDVDTRGYYSAATAFIAVPTGVKIYSWLVSLKGSSVRPWTPRMTWIGGFVFLFTFGGLRGIILSNGCLDIILHDTYYVVGHFHFVLRTGVVFCMMGGLITWYTNWVGLDFTEYQLKAQFKFTLINVLNAFIPHHFLGLIGMPRRYIVYPDYFWGWHEVRRFGAMGRRFTMLWTIFIIWDSMYYCRRVYSIGQPNTKELMENYWLSPRRHTFMNAPVNCFN